MKNSETCAIAVMAKAPQPGRCKTRLMPRLAPEQAAAMSAAFLRDITENIALAARHEKIHGCIAYAPAGSAALFEGHVAAETGFILADGTAAMPDGITGFGRCLFHAVQGLLADGFGAAVVVNSDSPTLPTVLLARAAQLLAQPGERAVLGPAEDGGYYLLGLKFPHAHLFSDIAWSTARVAAQTRRRAREIGLPVVELPAWYDVDNADALDRLIVDLAAPPARKALTPYAAPATAACIERLGLRPAILKERVSP
jgi:rSAM/selenodomain-associated transferase 1